MNIIRQNYFWYIILTSFVLYSCSGSKGISTDILHKGNWIEDEYSTPELKERLATSYFIAAKSKQFQNDYLSALDDYNFALSYSYSAVIFNNLGEAHLAINNINSAIEFFYKSIECDSTFILPYYSLIELHTNRSEFNEAARLGKKLVLIEPTQENKLKLAAIYHNIDLSESIKIIKSCIQEYSNYELYLYLLDIYKYLQQSDNALMAEEQYLRSPYKMQNTIDNLTEINIKNNQLLLSLKYIDTLQKYCSDKTLNSLLDKFYTITTNKEPFDFNTVHRLIKTVKYSTLDPNYKNVYLANLYLNKHDSISAKELYLKSANSNSKLLLSSVITSLNYDYNSIAYIMSSKTLDSLYFQDINQFVRVLELFYQQKDLNSALAISKKELAKYPTYYFLLTSIADAYMGLNMNDSALVYYEKAYPYFSDNIHLRNNYAYLISQSNGDLHKALDLVKYSLEQEPNSPHFLDTYGWVNFLLGNVDIAYDSIEKALKLMPNSAEGLLHWGYILYYKGDMAGAMDAWEKSYHYQNKSDNELIK